MPKSKPILILTHNRSTPLTFLPELLGGLGLEHVIHCAKTEGTPALPENYSGVIIMGGIMSAYDAARLPWLADEISWLSNYLVPSAIPTLGICLGCQLLAQVTGGKVFHGEQGHDIRFAAQKLVHDDPIFGRELAGCHTMRFHQDTYTLGPTSLRLAQGHPHIEQAARFASHLYGVQFHPEADAAWLESQLEQYLKYFDQLPNGQTVDKIQANMAQYGPAVRAWLTMFLRRLFVEREHHTL